MTFSINTKPLNQITTDAHVLLLLEDKITDQEKALNKVLDGLVQKLRVSKDFSGEANKTRVLFHLPQLSRILLVGLGKRKDLSLEKIREAISTAVKELKKLPVKSLSVSVPEFPPFAISEIASAITESLILSNYEFLHYKSPKEQETLEQVELLLPRARNKKVIDKAVEMSQILGMAVTFARDLGNHPSNVATPSHLAHHAAEIAKTSKNVKVKILHKSDIAQEKLGGLLAVSQGSDEEPKFIILEYWPRKTAPIVALVGKGITFDSGGVSIKPSEKLEEMKFDMAGAATVMAVIKAAVVLKLPINLVGLIPATENLPSGKAVKPGDIIRCHSGHTIEIINTDAEGRIVLADALDYAKKYKPNLVIDFATLTGAILMALGDDLIGAFTNTDRLLPKLLAAAKITGEKIWPMPLEESYEEFIKSEVAELRNIGTQKFGDAINAANFLKHFVNYPWIHLDIAGTAWATREKPYCGKGATGAGVRLAIEFLRRF